MDGPQTTAIRRENSRLPPATSRVLCNVGVDSAVAAATALTNAFRESGIGLAVGPAGQSEELPLFAVPLNEPDQSLDPGPRGDEQDENDAQEDQRPQNQRQVEGERLRIDLHQHDPITVPSA